MNKFILKTLSVAAVAAMLSTSAMADDQKYGVGVGVAGQSTLLRGIVNLDNDLRLEPFFAFGYQDADTTSNSNFQLGTSVEVVKSVSTNISAYYGGYVGLATTSVDITLPNGLGGTTTRNTSSTNFNLGPVAGVEYAFDKQFTLGAEVQFDLGFGDVTTFGTNSSVLLRCYF